MELALGIFCFLLSLTFLKAEDFARREEASINKVMAASLLQMLCAMLSAIYFGKAFELLLQTLQT